MMQPHVEAWARYCATHKATARHTLEYKIARYEMILQVFPKGVHCAVCGGWLQVGYKALAPTKDNSRILIVEYIHTAPEWCARATETKRAEIDVDAIKAAVTNAFDSVDREQRDGAQFDNPLLVVSARIALAWLDLDQLPKDATDDH